MARRVIYVLAFLIVVALAVVAFMPRPVPVETATVGPATIEVTVEEEGKARIRDVFTVSAPIAGRMLRPSLHPGDRVVAGDTVVASILPVAPALLDARARAMAEATAGAAAAAVELARAQLAQAVAQRDFLASEADRAGALVRRGTIPQRAYDKALLDKAEADAQVDSARANLSVREQELASALAALDPGDAAGDGGCCVEVTAPVSGRVLSLIAENEQVVQPGMPIMEIGDPDDLEIVVDLLSRDAVRIAPGAAATIDGWGGPPLHAAVTRIDPAAVTRVSALGIEEQRVTVLLDLAEKGTAALGHGFRVVVRITVWRGEDVLSVPVGALFRAGEDWAVWTVEDGRARLVRVGIGQRDARFAEVTEGLAAGATVILHPGDLVDEGVRVTAAEAPQPGD